MDTIKNLIEHLKSPDVETREEAIRALGDMGDDRAVKPLLNALRYGSPSVRQAIVTTLVKIGDQDKPGPFLEALENEIFAVRKLAAGVLLKMGWKPANAHESALFLAAKGQWDTLVNLGKDAVKVLLDALEDDYLTARGNAARVLGDIGDATAVEPLITVMKNDTEPRIRRHAALSLCKIGDAAAVVPLIDFIKGKPLVTQWKLLQYLEKINAPEAIQPLFLFMKKNGDFVINRKVMRVLKKIAVGAVGPVVETLEDDDYKTRRRAVKVLDHISWKPADTTEAAWRLIGKRRWSRIPPLGKDAVPPLLAVLEDKDRNIRNEVIITLGLLHDPRTVEPLIGRLSYESLPPWTSLVNALARIMNSGAVEPFMAALKHPNADLRFKTSEALHYIQWQPSTPEERAFYLAAKQEWFRLPPLGADAVEPLLNLINDEVPAIRVNAIATLGEIGDGCAVEPLMTALKDTDPDVRYAVVEALGNIGDPIAIEPLKTVLRDQEARFHLVAVTALGNMGAETVEFLIDLMKDRRRKTEIHEAAAAALGDIGDARAVEPLLNALQTRRTVVTGTAAEALGKIGDIRAVEPLFDVLNNKEPGWEKATQALGEIGDARAVEPLLQMEWQSREAGKILERIIEKIPTENDDYLCDRCLCRTEKHKPGSSFLGLLSLPATHLEYYACRKCHSDTYLTPGIKKVVLTLDGNLEETSLRNGDTLTVNWFKRGELVKGAKGEVFDYDEIRIENADDYEIEKCVLALRNDMDDQRRKRLREIPLYLAPGLEPSPAKLNLLKDVFTTVL